MNNTHTDELLIAYGWKSIHNLNFAPYRETKYIPARIIREGRGIYRTISPAGELLVQRSGTFINLQDLGIQVEPAIGDWCAVSLLGPGTGRIEAILPRQSVFHKPLGQTSINDAKIAAANIDKAVIVQDARFDFNIRRIERFLALCHTDKIPAMLVFTKADLLENPNAYRKRIAARFPDHHSYIIDTISGAGIDDFLNCLEPGSTLMLIGTSGAGKSTLVNRLCNAEIVKTAPIREKDGRGRHTTTTRQLYLLPNGALILDTPGIRMVGMHQNPGSIHDSFDDIARLAIKCKFSDCTHRGEPGCAVQKAVREGLVEQDRYFNFLRLMQEAQSREEVLQQSKQKKRAIGAIRYRLRRSARP